MPGSINTFALCAWNLVVERAFGCLRLKNQPPLAIFRDSALGCTDCHGVRVRDLGAFPAARSRFAVPARRLQPRGPTYHGHQDIGLQKPKASLRGMHNDREDQPVLAAACPPQWSCRGGRERHAASAPRRTCNAGCRRRGEQPVRGELAMRCLPHQKREHRPAKPPCRRINGERERREANALGT